MGSIFIKITGKQVLMFSFVLVMAAHKNHSWYNSYKPECLNTKHDLKSL